MEEGNVREGHFGAEKFGISGLSKGPWTWGTGGSSLKGRGAIKNGFGPALAAPAYGPGTERSGDPGLWVRNKEHVG